MFAICVELRGYAVLMQDTTLGYIEVINIEGEMKRQVSKTNQRDELITEITERLVILYANLSGRETANRSEFREEARKLITRATNRALTWKLEEKCKK